MKRKPFGLLLSGLLFFTSFLVMGQLAVAESNHINRAVEISEISVEAADGLITIEGINLDKLRHNEEIFVTLGDLGECPIASIDYITGTIQVEFPDMLTNDGDYLLTVLARKDREYGRMDEEDYDYGKDDKSQRRSGIKILAYYQLTVMTNDYVFRDEFDSHTSDPAAHHPRYTDAEAVAAMGIKKDSNSLNHDKFTVADLTSAMQSTIDALQAQIDTLNAVINTMKNDIASANSTAAGAEAKAAEASSLAGTAQSKADSAYSRAGAAQSKADSAYSRAGAAQSRANSAYSRANSAYNRAGTAQSKADSAYSRADAAHIRIETLHP